MYAVLPKEDKLSSSVSLLSIREWEQLFIRVSANYDSVISPAYYSPT